MRRMIALTVLSVCLAGGAAACSGSGQQFGGSPVSGGQSSGTEQVMNVLRQLARCMRSHGHPDWPDPNTLGEFLVPVQMVSPLKGADRPAMQACIKYVPGGWQYLQVGPAPQPASGGGGSG